MFDEIWSHISSISLWIFVLATIIVIVILSICFWMVLKGVTRSMPEFSSKIWGIWLVSVIVLLLMCAASYGAYYASTTVSTQMWIKNSFMVQMLLILFVFYSSIYLSKGIAIFSAIVLFISSLIHFCLLWKVKHVAAYMIIPYILWVGVIAAGLLKF